MATGISKAEQLSEDALSATLPGRDPNPLPSVDDSPAFQYLDKLDREAVLAHMQCSFEAVDSHAQKLPAEIMPNALVLSDNLLALHGMLAAGRRATLFYLDPPLQHRLGFPIQAAGALVRRRSWDGRLRGVHASKIAADARTSDR